MLNLNVVIHLNTDQPEKRSEVEGEVREKK
jgi:hypothetical protein